MPLDILWVDISIWPGGKRYQGWCKRQLNLYHLAKLHTMECITCLIYFIRDVSTIVTHPPHNVSLAKASSK